MDNTKYHSNLNDICKPQLDGYKTATRLAFERALHKTEGENSKTAGRVFRKVMSPAGVRYDLISPRK